MQLRYRQPRSALTELVSLIEGRYVSFLRVGPGSLWRAGSSTTRLSLASATKMLPAASTATATGALSPSNGNSIGALAPAGSSRTRSAWLSGRNPSHWLSQY
jgi:hypothetical protein